MALLPQLLDALADLGGHDRATWEVFARKLRDAGDLPRSKRGAGASPATAEDAAKLLLAGMTTDSPARASEKLGAYWTLQLRPHLEFASFDVLNEARLDQLGPAVADLITNAVPIARSLMIRLHHKHAGKALDIAEIRGAFQFELAVDRTTPSAALTIGEASEPTRIESSVLRWATSGSTRSEWSSSAKVSLAALLALSLAINGDV